MNIWKLLLTVGIVGGFLLLAAYLLSHSMQTMLRGVKQALRGEFKTDVGLLNFISMILFVFLYVFTDLHQLASNWLVVEKPVSADGSTVVGLILCGLGFGLSIICVMLVEILRK